MSNDGVANSNQKQRQGSLSLEFRGPYHALQGKAVCGCIQFSAAIVSGFVDLDLATVLKVGFPNFRTDGEENVARIEHINYLLRQHLFSQGPFQAED